VCRERQGQRAREENLVPNEHDDLWRSVFSKFSEPCVEMIERGSLSDVVDKKGALSPSIAEVEESEEEQGNEEEETDL
jgi:hypothetical protein